MFRDDKLMVLRLAIMVVGRLGPGFSLAYGSPPCASHVPSLLIAIYAFSLLLPSSRGASPFSAISLSTFSAVFMASTPAGTPQYVVA